MAKPTKAKEPKPKAEGDGDAGNNALGGFKGILINAALTIVIASIFLGASYIIFGIMLDEKLKANGVEEPIKEEPIAQMFFPYDLDEFIINLNGPNENRYLKAQISLDIERHEGEPEIGLPSGEEGGHGQAHGQAQNLNPEEHYNQLMKPYKMRIRDVIIAQLSLMTAEELTSGPGKEQAKDNIKEQINTVLPPDRQVLSVNFGEFIIQ